MTGPRTGLGAGPAASSLLLPGAALIGLCLAIATRHSDEMGRSPSVGLIALVLTGLPLVLRTGLNLLRGRYAADIVATLAIVTAFGFNQPIPGLLVVLMQAGGEALERYAEGRASRAVRDLEAAAPRHGHRIGGATLGDVPVDLVEIGDLLLVRPGERIPCDSLVVEGTSHVDTASLTGEPVPRRVSAGAPLMSGSLNQESPLTIRATARAADSQYARIVELVRTAQASKAPLQRLADRYAVWFTPLTLLTCFVAYVASGDPMRVLAVLVVATPCPLILATPVAIIGGINRAARRRIVFRTGTALEQVGGVNAVVFDKTGTLTIGRPIVAAVVVVPSLTRAALLRLAGAVEEKSSHLLARTLTDAARQEGVSLPAASGVIEERGRGVAGRVDGHDVVVGARGYVETLAPRSAPGFAAMNGAGPGLRAYIAVDGEAAGMVEYADRPRPEAAAVLSELAGLGVRRIQLLSGDTAANTEALARSLGIPEARGDLLAEDKVATVRQLVEAGTRVLMVGDGTNDAPALSAATVGVALAGTGGGVTAEAADIVLLADDLHLLPAAIRIGRETVRIARQSIWVGLGCSAAAMAAAAAGLIPPVGGAVLQEVIDVAVIVNALRASREPAVNPPNRRV